MTLEHIIDSQIDSLQTLAETISEVMGSPVTIEDESHRLLAYSTHDPNTDPARIATIVGRKVPEHVQRALYESGAMQRLLDSEEPQHIRELSEVGLRSRMAISVRHYDEVIGYIWLLENDGSYTAEQLRQFKRGARIAASKMIQQQQRQQKIELFRRLLNGRFPSEQEAAEQAREAGIELPDAGYVLVMEQGGQQDTSGWYDRVVQASAEYAVKIHLQLPEPNRLILLCGMNGPFRSDHSAELSARIGLIITRLRQLLPVEGLCYAAGEGFSSVLHIQRSYRQARELITLHQHLPETRVLHYYPDAGFYRYLNAMHREAEQFPVSWGPIDRLAAYDQEHNSNLLQTLAVFLDHDSDAKQAAAQLHVHTNTLNYRLRRIAEVGQVNLDSMAEKVTLYLELKLLWFDEGS
ncbi:PucR family transcriptional regulator [Paenibacillus wulumuqiensis]|uniref:PucR family transcriptional regulator n=1 Tax=Paenibacillus wulumuqiensis TaxID=1567107 RepID=UPI000619542D|nr:helix-turn-helix domain-containing protein [Paenibacillus wulumuqiensis]